ncbi:MAG: hypothetical protein LAQ30_12640 [Acidobacteriia bacterium]|nr:hypothetical protein [Terriglobia bacterium]
MPATADWSAAKPESSPLMAFCWSWSSVRSAFICIIGRDAMSTARLATLDRSWENPLLPVKIALVAVAIKCLKGTGLARSPCVSGGACAPPGSG